MPVRALTLVPLLALAACGQPEQKAAIDPGVCWRVSGAAQSVVERNVPNLETCAARLEVLRQQSGAPVEGRYQTVRLYVSAERIEAATAADAPRFRVFEPAALAELQAATTRRLAPELAPAGPPVAPELPPL